MRKTYLMLAALVLTALGATKVSADETISLQEVPFTQWSEYGANGSAGDPAECAWVVGEPTGLPYGDGSVINGADLSLYSKLIITYTEGTPRVMLNRDVQEGQWNADEAASKLIEYPKDGWVTRYFSNNTEEGIMIVDLKRILKDKGYVRLHAIKGANWSNVTVTSMELVREGKAQQVGWTSLINNGNMEGDDASSIFSETNYAVGLGQIGVEDGNVSSFYSKENGGTPYASVIEDGVGVNGSRGIKIHSAAGAAQDWDAQFWINASEDLPEGAKLRVSFDYRASKENDADAQAHGTPSCYIFYNCINANPIHFTTDWQTHTWEGVVPKDWATQEDEDKSNFHSIAFNLSKDRENDVDYFFDNIKFEVYKYGTTVEYFMDVLQVDFGFDTNIPDLVKACGKPRLVFPEGTISVTADGEPVEIMTVEGYPDGRFYIFLEDGLEDNAEVVVSFVNPTSPAYHLTYTSGPGGDISNFSSPASLNEDIYVDDAYSYEMVKPVVVASDPEDGAFNLPNSIKEFKVTFDKPVDCAQLVATLNGKALAVSPAEGFAEEVTLTRSGDDLADGPYVLKVTKIFCESPLAPEDFNTWQATINVGKVEFDPNDQPKEILPDYFATTNANAIPEGYLVKFGEEERTSETEGLSGGPRMFDFAEGGDFTKGLYFREGYVEYGSKAGYPLALEAQKKYNITFNTAMWKDNGPNTRFQIMNEAGDVILTQMVQNNPNVNGATTAVNGSTRTLIQFIPETSGNYILRWTSANDETSAPGFCEIVLANPAVRYIPNQVGVEETQLLNTALANAKTIRDENSAARYDGATFDALVAAIEKYESEMAGYTNPSSYKNAAADLDAKAQAVKDHRALCDKFDSTAQAAMQTVLDHANDRFAKHELYIKLKGIADKYVTVETLEDGVYINVKPLKDDAELTAAIAEMEDLSKVTARLFTEGESKTGDTGIKVVVDRIRQGAEGLKQLGVAEDDELIVAANNAVTDDDELAGALKNRLKLEFYQKMKDGVDLFPLSVDPVTEEPVVPTYNFTVFVKNPNVYAKKVSDGFAEGNVPGWDVPVGTGEVTTMWTGGGPYNIDGVAEDVAMTKYRQNARYQQTITDLPAGIYKVVIDATNWANDPNNDSFAFIKTSATPEVEEGAAEDSTVNFAAYQMLEYRGQYVGHWDNVFNVEVTDGVLTVGANFGAQSQFMFDQVHIYLAGKSAGFDYSKGYEEVLSGIDQAATEAKVRAIEVYDLNGRRLYNAQKGINIVRKQMSDGTIRTEKVVVK